MRRREFIAGLGGAVALPLAARSQRPMSESQLRALDQPPVRLPPVRLRETAPLRTSRYPRRLARQRDQQPGRGELQPRPEMPREQRIAWMKSWLLGAAARLSPPCWRPHREGTLAELWLHGMQPQAVYMV